MTHPIEVVDDSSNLAIMQPKFQLTYILDNPLKIALLVRISLVNHLMILLVNPLLKHIPKTPQKAFTKSPSKNTQAKI